MTVSFLSFKRMCSSHSALCWPEWIANPALCWPEWIAKVTLRGPRRQLCKGRAPRVKAWSVENSPELLMC